MPLYYMAPMNDPHEKETILQWCDGEPDSVHFWTSRASDGRRIEKLAQRWGFPVKKTSRPTWEATIPRAALRKTIFRASPEKKRTGFAIKKPGQP